MKLQDQPTKLGITYGEFVKSLFRPMSPPAMLSHAAMGIVTELGELALATDDLNAAEEVGDFLFFTVAYQQCLPHQGVHNDSVSEADDFEVRAMIDLVDVAKRWLAYDKEPTVEDCAKANSTAEWLVKFLIETQDVVTIQGAIDANVAKLQHRYKNGFSTQAALSRDLQGEAVAMTGATAA